MLELRRRLRGFFFPPPGARLWVRLLPFATLGVLTLAVLIGSVYAWDYTNSPEFCGTACHTMPPEYTAYLTSPHARVDCVECHIGRGFIATRISRKAGDLQHVFATIFQTYEFPIRADNLRPARETCERCHSPEKFSDDSLREIRHFGDDDANTPSLTYLIMHTGGGSAREGLGRGIHWHIENPVYFFTADPEQQEIPYIRVLEADGSMTEYVDIEADFDPASIDESALIQMDCITCHNRITHLVYTPERTVDLLMARGLISADIPEIRSRAVQTYGAEYASNDQAVEALAGLTEFYRQAYPDFFAQSASLIDDAVAALQEAYGRSVFPEQNSDWTTHPNNIGHDETAGCFRCHDGSHLNARQEAVRLECNLCHSIPVVTSPPDFLASIQVSRGIEPQSHLNPNWIALHRETFDPTCANCHSTDDPGGTSNTSFCSNSACHGSAWPFAGFDAPALREILRGQLPPPPAATAVPASAELTFNGSIRSLLQSRCGACHGPGGIQGLDLTSYAGLLAGGSSGPVVISGDSEGSMLIIKLTGATPHFAELSAQELDLVARWIREGLPED